MSDKDQRKQDARDYILQKVKEQRDPNCKQISTREAEKIVRDMVQRDEQKGKR